jgi:hypothetical protein
VIPVGNGKIALNFPKLLSHAGSPFSFCLADAPMLAFRVLSYPFANSLPLNLAIRTYAEQRGLPELSFIDDNPI